MSIIFFSNMLSCISLFSFCSLFLSFFFFPILSSIRGLVFFFTSCSSVCSFLALARGFLALARGLVSYFTFFISILCLTLSSIFSLLSIFSSTCDIVSFFPCFHLSCCFLVFSLSVLPLLLLASIFLLFHVLIYLFIYFQSILTVSPPFLLHLSLLQTHGLFT